MYSLYFEPKTKRLLFSGCHLLTGLNHLKSQRLRSKSNSQLTGKTASI
jgi:hypothetical protein